MVPGPNLRWPGRAVLAQPIKRVALAEEFVLMEFDHWISTCRSMTAAFTDARLRHRWALGHDLSQRCHGLAARSWFPEHHDHPEGR